MQGIILIGIQGYVRSAFVQKSENSVEYLSSVTDGTNKLDILPFSHK